MGTVLKVMTKAAQVSIAHRRLRDAPLEELIRRAEARKLAETGVKAHG